jgi:hypothetical protein
MVRISNKNNFQLGKANEFNEKMEHPYPKATSSTKVASAESEASALNLLLSLIFLSNAAHTKLNASAYNYL